MAVTPSTRLGINRWSSGNDPFNRSQADSDHALLDAKAALFTAGTLAARPAAGASNARSFYYQTDGTPTLFFSDGVSWFSIDAYAAPVAQTPGDAITQGIARTIARSDHKHSLPGWGIAGNIAATSTTAAAGALSTFARSDHAHAIGAASVVAGSLAVGGVNNSNQIATGVITSTHLAAGSVTLAAIAASERIPVGGVVQYAGTVLPSGYLWCDGTSYLTASQSGLFAVIGYSYGGAGANFNVPDLRGKQGRGAATPTSAVTLGVTGGADTHTITSTELPAHVHTVGTIATAAGGSHSHAVSGTAASVNIDHYHGVSGNTGAESANHTHLFNATSTGQSADHLHYAGTGNYYLTLGNTGAWAFASAGGGSETVYRPTTTAGTSNDHTHQVSGYTGVQTVAHSHGISVNSGTMSANTAHSHSVSGTTDTVAAHTHTMSGSTASTGTGSAMDMRDPFVTINYLIKV